MNSKTLVIMVFGLMFFAQGCANTWQGAKKDFKSNWESTSKADDWIRENLW